MTPSDSDLWFLPLGGTGEIGMNMNLYGHDGQWLMVDCGVTFAKPGRMTADGIGHGWGEPDIQMADPGFIVDRREQLAGIVITHAHEDHIGAIPYLWTQLQCPIYTNRFTSEILRRKLAEFDLLQRVPIHVVEADDVRQIGPFSVEWLALTHSIPDPNALMIRTPAGKIFHTGDWKLDDQPLVGHGYSQTRFQQLAEEGVDAMVCDSTNATVAGHSLSEACLAEGIEEHVKAAKGRVIVGCFGSNIARLQTLARVAKSQGRYMGLLGRSLITMTQAAKSAGLWSTQDQIITGSHLGYLPKEEVLAAATGSQGEARTALSRLAAGSHPDLELEAGDTVIFSSRTIPGNEEQIANLIERLKQLSVTVITPDDSDLPIHASGHPAADELQQMYQWVQPNIAIPVHGERPHIEAHAKIAKKCAVRHQLLGRNGDLYLIGSTPGIRRQVVSTGRLGYQRRQLVRVV